MALDGSVIAGITHEMQSIVGSRISKITQPEPDELILTFGGGSSGVRKLLISAGASLPLIYFTDDARPAPATAPAFCMLLRKLIGGGRVTSVTQPSLERVVRIGISHLDEMGDPRELTLITEIMGKHSNIILTDEEGNIIDSIKRVPSHVSSLREVLPCRPYFLPKELTKADTLSIGSDEFKALIGSGLPAAKALYTSLAGISPLIAEELCARAGADPDAPADDEAADALYRVLAAFADDVRAARFSPGIVMRGGEPVEFSVFPLTLYAGYERRQFDSVSSLLETYYREKELTTRIRQRSADLRHVTETVLARTAHKLDLQEKQMKDTEKADTLRLRGELLRAYSYMIEPGLSSVTLQDYNDDYKEVNVPLDPQLGVQENANRYYDRYQKLRRTAAALEGQIASTREALEHLDSILQSLDTAASEEDLADIRDELCSAGYMKKPSRGSSEKLKKSRPMHFVSCDGYDIYVGKNNYQNEEVTFRIADGGDWWFHAKGRPGSHVIVRSDGAELSDHGFEQAGALAAFYSSAAKGEKIEVDYTLRRNLKKPAAGRPGMVIYHVYNSMVCKAEKPELS